MFEELFEQVIHDGRNDPKKPWKIPPGKQVSETERKFRQLYRDRIAPTLGQRPVGTITAQEVEKVVRKALDERQTIAAPVLTLFRRVFDLAVMRDMPGLQSGGRRGSRALELECTVHAPPFRPLWGGSGRVRQGAGVRADVAVRRRASFGHRRCRS